MKAIMLVALTGLLTACASPSYDDRSAPERVGDNVWNDALYEIEREIGRSTRQILREKRR